MDFSSVTGDPDTYWAIPEDELSAGADAASDHTGGKLYHDDAAFTQQWTDLPFELSLPSPEYDATVNQALQRHPGITAATTAASAATTDTMLMEYSEDSIDHSRGSADSTDTTYEDGGLLLEDLLDSPYQENGMQDSFEMLMMEQDMDGCTVIPPHQDMVPGQSNQHHSMAPHPLDSRDPHPQYVRTHPIPPQQRQNWRGFARRQSISKMPLAQLYQIMGLPHNHSSAKDREERIMSELQKSGFQIGQQTWIRDTEESFRRNVIDRIYQKTKEEFGYSKHLLEAIIRRGTYARMQSNLRRRRRHMSRMKRRGPVYD